MNKKLKKKKPISIAARKQKARILQDWTCKKISEVTGVPWGKKDDFEIRPRPMGQSGTDVIMSPRVRELFVFSPECKNQKSWAQILNWIEQAKANCYPNTDWLLVMKRSGLTKEEKTEEVVMLDAKVFFALLSCIRRRN